MVENISSQHEEIVPTLYRDQAPHRLGAFSENIFYVDRIAFFAGNCKKCVMWPWVAEAGSAAGEWLP